MKIWNELDYVPTKTIYRIKRGEWMRLVGPSAGLCNTSLPCVRCIGSPWEQQVQREYLTTQSLSEMLSWKEWLGWGFSQCFKLGEISNNVIYKKQKISVWKYYSQKWKLELTAEISDSSDPLNVTVRICKVKGACVQSSSENRLPDKATSIFSSTKTGLLFFFPPKEEAN